MFGAYPPNGNTFYINEDILGIFAGFFAAALIFSLMIRLALFVIRAVGLYKVARRRGLRNAWLAWVPVCCDWILGSAADQYQYVVKGRIKNRRLPLFLLSLGLAVLKVSVFALGAGTVAVVLRMMMTGTGYPDPARTLLLTMLTLLQSGGAVAYLVIRCIALYDYYTSCTGRYNVLFLVLGLVFRFLEPVFFLICRDKEEGMPPRREAPAFVEPEVTAEEQV